MAINGLSTSFFNTSRILAKALFSCFFIEIKVDVTLRSTASKMEHRKEKKIYMVVLIISKVIIYMNLNAKISNKYSLYNKKDTR